MTVRRQEPPEKIGLPDIDLHVPGKASVALPDNVAADRLSAASVHLLRSESGHAVDVKLGETAVLDDADVMVTADNGQLLIDAKLRSR